MFQSRNMPVLFKYACPNLDASKKKDRRFCLSFVLSWKPVCYSKNFFRRWTASSMFSLLLKALKRK